jgi:hypothetical protein
MKNPAKTMITRVPKHTSAAQTAKRTEFVIDPMRREMGHFQRNLRQIKLTRYPNLSIS